MPYRVYWLIFLRPASPSFFSASSDGTTVVRICMMMEAEMYGMIERASTDMRPIEPPENTSRRPAMPPAFWAKISAKAAGSTPGTGM